MDQHDNPPLVEHLIGKSTRPLFYTSMVACGGATWCSVVDCSKGGVDEEVLAKEGMEAPEA